MLIVEISVALKDVFVASDNFFIFLLYNLYFFIGILLLHLDDLVSEIIEQKFVLVLLEESCF